MNTSVNRKEPLGLPPGSVRAVLFLLLGLAAGAQAVLDDSERALVIAGAIPVAYSALKGVAWLGKVLASGSIPRALTGETISDAQADYPQPVAAGVIQAEDFYQTMRRQEHAAQMEIATQEARLKAAQRMEIEVRIELGRGQAVTTVWTCDYSYDYVKINAEYTT